MTPEVSVIIPTRHRLSSVRRTLAALASQTAASSCFEVIVVVNDSADGTARDVRAAGMPYALRAVEIAQRGIATARNAGVSASRGALLAFLDDDIEPVPGWVGAHAGAHGTADVVAVGALAAPPRPAGASLMTRRLGEQDEAFSRHLQASAAPLTWQCATGGNMSMPASLFARVGGFAADIRGYGTEDYEFACRAQAAGARFLFVRGAEGCHHRDPRTTLRDYLERARSVGRNDALAAARCPSLVDGLPIGRVLRSRSWRGHVARVGAFDYPAIGDALAGGLEQVARALEVVRCRGVWSRTVDALYEYAYFRGAASAIGNRAAVATYLADLAQRDRA